MADDAGTGDGPGVGYVPPWGIFGIAVYLVGLTFALMFGLMSLWPACEVAHDTARATTALTVTSVTPSSGKLSGGDVVTIRGTGFADGATVSFGDAAAAEVQFVNPTSLTARSPAHKAGRVDIVVSNPDTKSHTLVGGFIYVDPQVQLPKPSLSSLTPASGPLTGGQSVTITGTGFSSVTTVSFGGLPGTNVQVLNDRTLTATTPVHAEGKVDVVVGDGSTAALSASYTYTCWVPYRLFLMVIFAGALGGTLHGLRSLFWYVGNRDLRYSWLLMYFLLPVSGAAIAVIFFLVTYAGFYTVQGTGNLIVVGLAAVVGMFSPQAAEKLKKIAEGLLTNAPQGANTVVPQPAGATAQPPALAVTAIAPSSGSISGGTAVTITGTGFAAGVTVSFGGTAALNVAVGSPTSITATTPSHTAGRVDVVVTNVNRQSYTLRGGYLYVSLTLVSGPSAGGQSVTITGAGFLGVTTVTFGGTPATNVQAVNDTTITATTPAHAPGRVDVVVGSGPTSVTLPGGYTYT